MPTPIQKGYYNEAYDEDNLLGGTPTVGDKSENGGDGEQVTPSPTTVAADASYTPSYEGYDQMIKIWEDAQKDSKAEQEKARRQERLARAHSFTGGLADLGRAMSNMYYTTQYAPNGYDHSKDSQSEKAKARADKWMAERQRLQKEYYNYAMQGANAKQGKENAQLAESVRAANFAEQRRQFDATMEQKQKEEARREAELELKQKRQEVWEEMQRGNLDIKKLNAWTRSMEAKYKMSRSDINHNLASYIETNMDIYDDHHRKIGTKRVRLVVNPKTGDLEKQEELIGNGSGNGGNGNGNGNGNGSSSGTMPGVGSSQGSNGNNGTMPGVH